MEREPPHRPHGAEHPALDRVRREGRWWWLQARHARRVWRWALVAALAAELVLSFIEGSWFCRKSRCQARYRPRVGGL
ncbi:hypothetical protein BMR86_06395 [Stenotrophomonas sp. KAs 5-3]|nr:hypothetical protein BMR86_06395 [Stenotrophomonas sp. KAs 5-3]